MIVTRVALFDIAKNSVPVVSTKPLPNTSLLLASAVLNGHPKLVGCHWLAADVGWQASLKMTKLAKHHQTQHIEQKAVQFITANILTASVAEQQLLLTTIAQIQQYFQGLRQDFDVPMDISIGTAFQQKVWHELQKIPYGATLSYANIAQRIDNPKGFRAVANANASNPLSIIIPCHRVIAHDGKIGGYTGGVDKKSYLLAHEGVYF